MMSSTRVEGRAPRSRGIRKSPVSMDIVLEAAPCSRPRCAPARGWQMRGSARAAKGGPRDVPPPTPHCARTAGRATHAQRGHRRAHQQRGGASGIAPLAHATAGGAREAHARRGARLGTATRVAASRARENERPPTSLASATSALVARSRAGVFWECGESGRAVARGAHAAEG